MKIGKNCLICSNLLTPEPFLIEIGNNSTISTGVSFITHDFSVHLLIPNSTDCFGRIRIGDNCFVGANTTLLYGITLADNIIVAAGSVVTKSFDQSGIIIGGNPARKIGDWESFSKQMEHKAIRKGDLKKKLESDDSFLVVRQSGE